jgi:hypothetical protein
MTELLPELSALSVAGTFDGELVAYVVFDLPSLRGRDLTGAPYSERRAQLEALDLNGVYWQTPETFDDRAALFEAVCAHGPRVWALSAAPSVTGRRSVAGSRPRTAGTGAGRWSASQRSISRA